LHGITQQIQTHLAAWQTAVRELRLDTHAPLQHKKRLLFAWKVRGQLVGSTCPHFDTVCFRHALAVLHLHLGQWQYAQGEAELQAHTFQQWRTPQLTTAQSCVALVFPDFHRAVAAYAATQDKLAMLNLQLAQFPHVPAYPTQTVVSCLRLIEQSKALNLKWGLRLHEQSVALARLGRGLVALETLGYKDDSSSAQLSRAASWKEAAFPTALAVLNMVPLQPHKPCNLGMHVERILGHSRIESWVFDLNNDVYHLPRCPNFEKTFEDMVKLY
jgi:hypothetical protein